MAERLDLADPGVARELLAHRAFVHELARRLLRDAASAEDVAQETVVRLLAAKRPAATQPWLRTVARNLVRRLGRTARRRGEVEDEHGRESRVAAPSTAEIAQRLELERRLTERVLALEPPARDVVLLHFFEGRTVPETAAQLGIPLETARTRLRRALDELRASWNAEHGGRRDGLAALALMVGGLPTPALAPANTIPSSLAVPGGALAMASITPIRAAVVMVVAASAFVVWELLPESKPRRAEPLVAAAPTPAESAAARADTTPSEGAAPVISPAERLHETPPAAPVPPAPTTGELELQVHFARDRAPADGVTIVVRQYGGEGRIGGLRAATDTSGRVLFGRVGAGRVYVTSDRFELGAVARVRAGERTHLEIEIPLGLSVRGVVVDPDGEPVPDAWIEVAPLATSDVDGEVVATSDEEGRFEVRDVYTACLVGARAEGYTASRLVFFSGQPGNDAETRLELGADGGSLDVDVAGPDGAPLAGAVVRAGRGETSGICPTNNGVPPLPALARCGADGRVHLVGLPAGVQPVAACLAGFAPFAGTCTIVAGKTTTLRATLAPGATVRGMVRDGAGRAVASASVAFGTYSDFVHLRTLSASDGRYELRGLPAGQLSLSAEHDELGETQRSVRAVAGEVVECDLVVSRGLELVGRILDEARAPVAGAMVTSFGNRSTRGFEAVMSDADGRFSIANCPETGKLRIEVRCDGIEEVTFDAVDPKASNLVLTVRRTAAATARLTGVVLGPDGHGVPNAHVSALPDVTPTSVTYVATDADGRFTTGVVPPGEWRISVSSAEFPVTTSAPFSVAANQTRDVGAIALATGGRIALEVAGERMRAWVRVYTADGGRHDAFEITDGATRPRSGALTPGDYQLELFGDEVAAQSLRCSVRAGEETLLRIDLKRGVRQVVALALPGDVEFKNGVMVRIERGGEVVASGAVFVPRGSERVEDVNWLAPGDYVVTASGAGRSASASFSVASSEGAAVRVELK
jgi:RNA polymerase sigma-70 factor (ECF subfamily)